MIETIKSLPDSCGIYQYFDKNKKLLYVGKAKSLKKRVKSYFNFTPFLRPSSRLSPRIYKMIQETKEINYILTNSENDALILENSLIKQLKPKYNILLRDDKTYPYIYIDLNSDFPRFEITRKIIKGKNIKFFGPFATGGKDILESIYEIFPLVQKKALLKNKKACLFYQIKKCLAPCENKVSKQEYLKIVSQASDYIANKEKIVKKLYEKMLEYSSKLQFEEAAKLKTKIENIKKSSIISGVDLASKENFDILAIANNDTKAIAVRLFIRDGKVISSSDFSSRFSFGFDKDEAYKRAILETYSKEQVVAVDRVYVYEAFDSQNEISKILNIKIINPKRGKKLALTKLAFKNANELLKTNRQKENILFDIKELFELDKIPFSIEIFDNSHMQGSANVGAMVVYEENSFNKSKYRHYNLEQKDEFHQMKELLTKRAKSFLKNPPPDLWVIDGGKTLMDLANDILASSGVFIDVVAIAKEKLDFKAHRAKGSAKDIIYYKDKVFHLKPTDKRLQFFQNLRDEAHRFAISFHRKQKIKLDKHISLLEISGIKQAKIQKLLNYFGTFENIKNASLQELKTLLNQDDALKIYNHYKK
jgi:excinuclease ABC subunit C